MYNYSGVLRETRNKTREERETRLGDQNSRRQNTKQGLARRVGARWTRPVWTRPADISGMAGRAQKGARIGLDPVTYNHMRKQWFVLMVRPILNPRASSDRPDQAKPRARWTGLDQPERHRKHLQARVIPVWLEIWLDPATGIFPPEGLWTPREEPGQR